MTWIKPLEMETWIINVFSGDINIFTAISILVICSMAGYFRMNNISLALLIGLFFLMFKGFIVFEIYFIILAISSLLIGYTISKIVKG